MVTWQYKRSSEVEHFKIPLEKACDFGDMYYQIHGMAKPIRFKGIPCAESLENTKFSFIADTQEGPETSAQFAEMIDAFDSHAVILGGDIVQTASDDDEWVDLFKALSKATSHRLMVPVIGNHEYRDDSEGKYWEKYFGFKANEAFYSVWLGSVKLIAISSNFEDDPSMVLKQLAWLDSELAKPAPWKIVVFHHPPFSRSIMHASFYWRREFEPLRQYYVPLFEKHKVDMVLNGHSHIYERSIKDGIHYVTTGAAGGKAGTEGAKNPFEIKAMHERTVVQFEVSSTALRMISVNLTGKTIDNLLLTK